MNEWTDYSEENCVNNLYEKCALCGYSFGQHKASNNACCDKYNGFYKDQFFTPIQKESKMIDWTKPIETEDGLPTTFIRNDLYGEFNHLVIIEDSRGKIAALVNGDGNGYNWNVRNKAEEQVRYIFAHLTAGFDNKPEAMSYITSDDTKLIKITFRNNQIHSMEVEKE